MDADDDADVNVEVEEDGEEAVVHPTSLDNKTPAFLIQHYQTGVAVYRPGSASNCAVTAYGLRFVACFSIRGWITTFVS